MAGPIRINGLPPVQESTLPRAIEPGQSRYDVGKPFSSYLEEQVKSVNQLQKEADATVASVATGQSANLHEMMIALDKADVSFRMLTRIRNKVVDAYQEIMRMSV
jgi:flagellar hook-basal body complex protein FliE